MKMLKRALFILLIFAIMVLLPGCWNYRELDDLDLVAGVAIDKNTKNKNYLVTIEIINAKGGKDSRITPDIMEMEGETVFDAIRNMIRKVGRKLYWGHSKVLIISQDIAREGIVEAIDFINRDAEARADMYLVISEEKTAAELLKGKDKIHDTISFHIVDIMESQKSIQRYEVVELWQFLKYLSGEGVSAALPTAILVPGRDDIVPQVTGMAVFKKDKMVGWLDGIESRSLLFIRGKIKSGFVFAVKVREGSQATLEVSKAKTKLKSGIKDGKITMDIDVKIDAAIAEVIGKEDLISKDGRQKLVKVSEETIKKQLEDTIKKVQREYKSDVFGFGSTVDREMPKIWKEIKSDWDEIFPDVETNVSVKVEIKGSALTSKPIKVGD